MQPMTDIMLLTFAIAAGGYGDFCQTNQEICQTPPKVVYMKLNGNGRWKGVFRPAQPHMIGVSIDVERGSPEEEAVKVHEFVHYLQHHSKKFAPYRVCFTHAEHEKEAYLVMEKFLNTVYSLTYGEAIPNKILSEFEPCWKAQRLGIIR